MQRKKRASMKRRTKEPKSQLSLLNLKVTERDRKAFNARAKEYANGNVSAWLRMAGINFRPAKT